MWPEFEHGSFCESALKKKICSEVVVDYSVSEEDMPKKRI